MTDEEIKQYLIDHSFVVNAKDGISDILNTSYQIIDKYYDFTNDIVTLITPNNVFTFKWKLGNGK